MPERPYIYAFDGNNLVDGQAYTRLSVNIQNDAPFVMRRMSGFQFLSATTGRIQVYKQNMDQIFGLPVRAGAFRSWPIVPGIVYQPNSYISFDVSQVLRASSPYSEGGSIPNFRAQVAFQGAKQVDYTPYQTPYPYYERPYTYVTDVTITEPGRTPPALITLSPPRQYSQVLLNEDFELLYVSLFINPADFGTEFEPADIRFKILLYDSSEFPVSNVPLLSYFINWASRDLPNGFPNPTMVWPANGQIKFDLTSLLITQEVPARVRIEWHGVNRVPCLAGQNGVPQ